MRFSWKAIVGGVTAAALFASSTTLGLPSASAQPTPPTRFFGTVALSGGTAPAGATVQATVGSTACGSGAVTGGSYVVDVNSASTTPGCARDGDTVSFTVNGVPARETGRFQTGAFVSLNLTAQAATATPTAVATVARTATAAPTAAPTVARTATAAPTAAPTVARTATAAPTAPPAVRTPTPIAATPRPQGAVGAPQAQRPGGAAPAATGGGAAAGAVPAATGGGAAAAPARPAATGGGAQAAALPRTGAAVTADSSTSTGWTLAGIALAAIMLGAGSLVVTRKTR